MTQDENDSTVENNTEEQQNQDEPNDVEDRLRLTLESAMKPTEKIDKLSAQSVLEYTNRLSSFSPLTYFGKPSCLSPLVCARLGWRNAEPDLLVCSSCQVALAVTLPHGLSPDSKDKICRIYREKLATCHQANCPFTVVAKELVKCDKNEQDCTIPAYMTDVFASDCVELVEHPRPSHLLQSRVLRLQEFCPAGYQFPQEMEIPNDVRQELDSLKMAELLKTTEESLGVLAISGWEPSTEKPMDAAGDSPVRLTLGCRFCHSFMEVALEKEAQEENEQQDMPTTTSSPPPAKKTKLSKSCAPLDAHRHYCPYVCGFPSQLFSPKKPMWKTIVGRLHKEAEDQASTSLEQPQEEEESTTMTDQDYDQAEKAYDETVYRINDILNSAIAPVDPRLALLDDEISIN